MKILHVVRGLSNSSGTTHIVGPLSEEQARQGCQVNVYHVEKNSGPIIEPDAALVTSSRFALTLPFSNPGVSIGFAGAMDRTVASFDLVHIHAVWNFPTYYAMQAAHRAGVPYIVAPQGSFDPWALRQSRWRKKLYGRLFEVPLLNRAARLQALTAQEAEQFRLNGLFAPAEVVPNGVNEQILTQEAEPLARHLGLDPGHQTLLFLSRIHPKKGLDTLIKAFAHLSAVRQDVTLVVAGSDAGSGYRDTLARLAVETGVHDRCRFIGEVRGREKIDALLGADVFALLSHSEGLPVAVLEAMAAGLPVVITDRCNLPEVERHGAGRVLGGDIEATAQALWDLFDDRDRARMMGENGRRLIREKYTWPRIARQTIEIYEQATARDD